MLDSSTISKLLPWQVEPANRLIDILSSGRNAIDGSDTGVGKMFVGAAVSHAMKLPTLVVCPVIITSTWKAAAAHFGDTISSVGYEMLRTGTTPYGRWENPIPEGFERGYKHRCEFCQCHIRFDQSFFPCHCHPTGIHCIKSKKIQWRLGRFLWHPAVKLVIFDEAHRTAGEHSQTAQMLIDAHQQGKRILLTTATPACTPMNLRAIGYSLGLHGLRDWQGWLRKHHVGCLPGMPGLRWTVGQETQQATMDKLRSEIFDRSGVRVRSKDIPGFPERIVQADLFDIEKPDLLDHLYDEMREAMEALTERRRLDVDASNPLTRILRARQEVELLKVPIALSLAEDYLAKGHSIVYFCNFVQTIDEICRRRKMSCVIDGRQTSKPKLREKCISDFQLNVSREIAVNNQAGGVAVSLQDLTGDAPRVGLTFPTFSALTMHQLFGRIHRAGGKSLALYRVLFANSKVEKQVHAGLAGKLNNLDALTNADWTPEKLRLTNYELLITDESLTATQIG